MRTVSAANADGRDKWLVGRRFMPALLLEAGGSRKEKRSQSARAVSTTDGAERSTGP